MAEGKAQPTVHPVDKGWAWIIMCSAFTVHFFSVGYERSFGILYVEFQEKFDCSSTLISAIIGAKSISYCLTTVMVMNLVLKKLTVRTSCMTGCLIQSMGVAVSSLVTDPAYLVLTQGVLFGIGHALLYCPTLFILSQYFDRYRPITTAIASCGTCLGGIAFPALTRTLLEHFGLSGTLLLLGSILFHQELMVVLYTPPDDYNVVDSTLRHSISSRESDSETDPESTDERKYPLDDLSTCLQESTKGIDSTYCANLNDDDVIDRDLMEIAPKPRANTATAPIDREDVISDGNPQVLSYSFGDISINGKKGVKSRMTGSSALLKKALANHIIVSHSSLSQLPTKEAHSKSHEFLRSLSESANGMNQIHTSMPSILIYGLPRSSNRSSKHCLKDLGSSNGREDDDMIAGSFKRLKSSTSDSDEEVVSLSKGCLGGSCSLPEVMQLPLFWVLLLYFACGAVGTGFPPIYIPSLAQEKGLTREDGAYFLMISASIEIIGRFLPGFILHFRYLQPCQLMLMPPTCLGVLFLFTPVFEDFQALLGLTLVYGLMSSSFWATQTLVVIEVLGLDRLASSIGFYAVFMGLSSSISFPFGGWLRDATGTYSSTFMFLGLMYLMAVASLGAVHCLTHLAVRRARTGMAEGGSVGSGSGGVEGGGGGDGGVASVSLLSTERCGRLRAGKREERKGEKMSE